jgi:hypothetical protein
MDKQKKLNFLFVTKGKMRERERERERERKKSLKMASCFEMAVISMQIHYFWEYWI